MSFINSILSSKLFNNAIMPLAIVFITLYCERKHEREKREQEERIKSFLLFIDIDMKIKNIQMSLRHNVRYSIPSNSLNYEQVNDLLIYIARKLTIEDINIINMFYNNYIGIENIVNRREKENLPIMFELQKVASTYKRIYKNESMINCYNKLYNISTLNNMEKGYNKANFNLNLEEEVNKAMEIVDETITI